MLLSFFLNYRNSGNTQFFFSDKRGSARAQKVSHATQAAWEAARETPAGSPIGQDERERTSQRAKQQVGVSGGFFLDRIAGFL